MKRLKMVGHARAWALRLPPLLVLAAVLVPAVASASIAVGPETRVMGFDLAGGPRVGFEGDLSRTSRQAYRLWYGGTASGSLVAPNRGAANRWAYRQAKGTAYDRWVNETYYGGGPAKKPFVRIDGRGRYLDNLVDEGGVRVGVENKYFRLKGGTQDVNVGVRKGTALRRDLAETLRRGRSQARSHQRLLEEGVLDRFEWNLSGNYPKFQQWLEHLGLDVHIRPMP